MLNGALSRVCVCVCVCACVSVGVCVCGELLWETEQSCVVLSLPSVRVHEERRLTGSQKDKNESYSYLVCVIVCACLSM